MRQIGAEKEDPLKRIQAEINEVEKRERELREKKMMLSNGNGGGGGFVTGGAVNQSPSSPQSIEGHSSLSSTPDKDQINDSVSAFSDDSGISSSPSPVNGQSTTVNHQRSPPKYIRSNTVQNTIGTSRAPSASMLSLKLSRTVSTPQIHVPANRFTIHPSKKGIMERFIASRGRIAAANAASVNGMIGNGGADRFANEKPSQRAFSDSSNSILTSVELNRSPNYLFPVEIVSTTVIERDADGRPIRRGFIPVEEKIQRELRDLRSRETELKRLRRENELRQSQMDLLDCIDHSNEFDSDDGSEDEYCYMAGKLRSSKSISELCDALTNSSLSERDTPSPHFQRSTEHRSGMKPALSLAQLCDVTPDEAPSSHRLIAQWENIIQQNS